MKNFEKDLVEQLSELYQMYENYMWKHEGSNLEVLIQDSTICFYLYDGSEVIDEIVLTFDSKENNLWNYLSLRVMLILFDNAVIYRDDNVLYNTVHKSYLKLTVNDDYILDMMDKIISMQYKVPIYGEMEFLEDMRKDLPWRLYPNKFMKRVNERIGISRKLLRVGGYK